MRILNLLEACARDFAVTLVCPVPEDQGVDLAPLRRLCAEIVLIEPPAAAPGAGAVLRYCLSAGLLAMPTRTGLMQAFAHALGRLDVASYDLVWVERPALAALVKAQWHRTVVDLDDLEHRKLARSFAAGGWWRVRPREWLRASKYALVETRTARRFRAALVCSNEDRDHLVRHGLSRAVVVPNGTALVAPAGISPSGDEGLRLAFVGNLAYGPNADALGVLRERIVPDLRGRLPGMRLDVFGAGGPADRSDPDIRFHGFVPDLAAELAACHVFVAPIRYGSGTKLKILDAMALRMPIVTTTVGAEGLGLEHGVSALIHDDPVAFAQAVFDLSRDPLGARRMGEAAGGIADREFRWEGIRSRTADWLADLAGLPPQAQCLTTKRAS